MARRTPALTLGLLATLLGQLTTARADDTTSIVVGAEVGELELVDVRYRVPRGLDDLLREQEACVLAFTTLDCPLAGRYLPRLVALEAELRARGVRFALVNVGPKDGMNAVAARALEAGVDFAVLEDARGDVARALGVERTPEVVVIDGARRLRYRGRIDDQHRVTGERPAPTRADLREALEDVLAGRPVHTAETTVDGCRLPSRSGAPGSAPTFDAVSPILERACQSCHRPGGQAPFELVTYEDARALSDTIAEVVRDERMPPWYASPPAGAPFANHPPLTADERAALIAWAEADAPAPALEADQAVPREHDFPPDTGWTIDEPDLVLSAATEAKLPAEGFIAYRYELLPHVFEHETWLAQIQIRPSNPRVMHHCNLAYVLPDDGFKEAHFLTGQVPGGEPARLEAGLGLRLPAGAMLVLQIHYVTTGKEERDRVSVALRYPRDVVRKEVRHLRLSNHRFEIAPGAPAHEVRDEETLDADVTALALFMHMHLRGRDATFRAHRPDGAVEQLLQIPAYSFDWQLTYHVAPGQVRLPRGTRVECIGHYDNSAWNPFNPDPSATVREGAQTHEEMFFGFFFYTEDAERLDVRVDPRTGRADAKKWW